MISLILFGSLGYFEFIVRLIVFCATVTLF